MKLKLRHFFSGLPYSSNLSCMHPTIMMDRKKINTLFVLFNKMGCNLENLLMSLLESSSSSCCADVFIW